MKPPADGPSSHEQDLMEEIKHLRGDKTLLLADVMDAHLELSKLREESKNLRSAWTSAGAALIEAQAETRKLQEENAALRKQIAADLARANELQRREWGEE